MSYATADQNADAAFNTLQTANNLNYVMGAGTSGSGDTFYNGCGIAESHAYSLIATFELKTGSNVDYKMYMMRNPWGRSTYTGTFR